MGFPCRLFETGLLDVGLLNAAWLSFLIILFVGIERLPFKPEGYNFWTWRGHKIHYVVQGEGPPIVLIHGFGASVFHWRSGLVAIFGFAFTSKSLFFLMNELEKY